MLKFYCCPGILARSDLHVPQLYTAVPQSDFRAESGAAGLWMLLRPPPTGCIRQRRTVILGRQVSHLSHHPAAHLPGDTEWAGSIS